jgi:hypothetical protein
LVVVAWTEGSLRAPAILGYHLIVGMVAIHVVGDGRDGIVLLPHTHFNVFSLPMILQGAIFPSATRTVHFVGEGGRFRIQNHRVHVPRFDGALPPSQQEGAHEQQGSSCPLVSNLL